MLSYVTDVHAARVAQACTSSRQGQAARHHLKAAGLGTAAVAQLVKDGGLIRLRRGAYALEPLPPRGRHLLSNGVVDLGFLAEVRAVLHSLGDEAVADRRTAAALWQMDMLVEPKDIDVRVSRSRTRVALPGVRARCSTATASTTVRPHGLDPVTVTSATDTVLDSCLDRPMLEAVCIADSALRRELVTVQELQSEVEARKHQAGVRKLRRLLTLIDPRSGSVLESMLRFLLNTHGLWPTSQVEMTLADGKTRVGRVDFCFRGKRIVIECDGRRWHDPADARDNDRRRDNGLARTGYLVLRFTWDEVRNSAVYVLACVRDALAAAT